MSHLRIVGFGFADPVPGEYCLQNVGRKLINMKRVPDPVPVLKKNDF